jgi:hypothetical protein
MGKEHFDRASWNFGHDTEVPASPEACMESEGRTLQICFVDYPTPSHALSPGSAVEDKKERVRVFSAQAKIDQRN